MPLILMLTQCLPPDPGGIETTMGGLVRLLGETGSAVLVLADRIRGGGVEPDWPTGVMVRRFGGPKPLRRLRKQLAARSVLSRDPVGAVLADSWKSLELLGERGPRPVVLVHGMEFPSAPSARKAARIRTSLARAGAIVANSHYTAGRVAPLLAAAPERLTVVQPAIPPQPAPSASARAALAGMLAGHGPVLLSLCRLEPRKGIDQVISALPALCARHPGLLYLVAGGGEDSGRLAALARSLGVDGAVRLLGRVDADAKAALYAAADLFAMPARRVGDSVEGFGTTYLEAAWYGVPSLAGRDGGAAEAVIDGVTGQVCDGADADSVLAALAAMLEDRAGLAAMGRAAATRVRDSGVWPAVAPRWRELLGLTEGRG